MTDRLRDALVDPRLWPLAEEVRAHVDGLRAGMRGKAPEGAARTLADPELVAEIRRMVAVTPPLPGSVAVAIDAVDGPGGPVPLRVVRPAGGGPVTGVHLHLHGGGHFCGTAQMDDPGAVRLAEQLGMAVVSPDYRLAPEHPWPADQDDVEVAALWVLAQAGPRFGTDVVTIGGESAGANLAVATLLRLRTRGLLGRVAAALALEGVFDYAEGTPSLRQRGFEGPAGNRLILENYVGHLSMDERRRPEVSPVFADLSGLPPLLVTAGTTSHGIDDAVVLAARVAVTGGEAELQLYPEVPHSPASALDLPGEPGRIAAEHVVAFLRRHALADARSEH